MAEISSTIIAAEERSHLQELHHHFNNPDLAVWDQISPLDEGNLSSISHNLSILFNASGGLNLDLISRFERNRKLEGPGLAALFVVYGCVITVGAAGNWLVVVAVLRKAAMRTARNVFIVNLAVSDLVLCLVTAPLTLLELLTQYWPLGNTPVLCRLVGSLQAGAFFLSTASITAIALDRCQVILHPGEQALSTYQAVLTVPLLWLVSVFLSLPQFLFRNLSHHVINLPGLRTIDFCYEDWPINHGRAFFSVFVMLVQFCVPLITVTISYARIVRKLKCRMPLSSRSSSSNIARKEYTRNKKTNTLLMAIALIFCLSWLPFHVYSVFVDFFNPFGDDTEAMLAVYAVCHLLGMSSACSNPVLYGWLNDNFRKEFSEIYRAVCPCIFTLKNKRLLSPGIGDASMSLTHNMLCGEQRDEADCLQNKDSNQSGQTVNKSDVRPECKNNRVDATYISTHV